ncbi:hypothetical protein ACROYT_G003923 [Oculina patagonica]
MVCRVDPAVMRRTVDISVFDFPAGTLPSDIAKAIVDYHTDEATQESDVVVVQQCPNHIAQMLGLIAEAEDHGEAQEGAEAGSQPLFFFGPSLSRSNPGISDACSIPVSPANAAPAFFSQDECFNQLDELNSQDSQSQSLLQNCVVARNVNAIESSAYANANVNGIELQSNSNEQPRNVDESNGNTKQSNVNESNGNEKQSNGVSMDESSVPPKEVPVRDIVGKSHNGRYLRKSALYSKKGAIHNMPSVVSDRPGPGQRTKR